MIAIIDYDAGNLASVFRAVSHLGFSCAITKDVHEIKAAERIIFPGVGAAGAAMESLQHSGLDVVINEAFARGKPILGICLGSQIILTHSEENSTSCLGILGGTVRAFAPDRQSESGNQYARDGPIAGYNQNMPAAIELCGTKRIDANDICWLGNGIARCHFGRTE